MKTKQLLVPLEALCVIAALLGCASTNRQVSESTLDGTSVNRDEGQFIERILKMGGAGDSPAPVGDSPTGTALSYDAERPLSLARTVVSAPHGGAPDGTGDSPVLLGNHVTNPFLAEPSRQVNPTQLELQKPDLNTNGPVTLDERQQFDTSAGPMENFRAFEVNGERQISTTEFLTPTPKNSKRYHFFGETENPNQGYVSWDRELFRQPGWQLFSIRF